MAKPKISRNTAKGLAALSGLSLTDEKLDQLLPQIQQSLDSMSKLDNLGLESVEPAIIFKSERK